MIYYRKYDEDGALHHEWYNTVPWYKEVADLCVSRAVGKTALDLGCGDGLVCKLLLKAGYSVCGVDSNQKGIELAKKLAPGGAYIVADLNNCSMNWAYDYMVCLNTIEHLENPKNIVKIFEDSVVEKCLIITDKKIKGQGLKRHHFQEFNIKELKELFKDFVCKEIKLKTSLFIALEVLKK